jgi:hypothetical protein
MYRPERSPPRCSTEIVRVSITLADSYQRRNGYTHRYIVTLRTRRYSMHQARNATPNVIPSAWSRLSRLVTFQIGLLAVQSFITLYNGDRESQFSLRTVAVHCILDVAYSKS